MMSRPFIHVVQLMVVLGCFSTISCSTLQTRQVEGKIKPFSLELIQAGNITSFIPAQIFVSRAGSRNLLPRIPEKSGIVEEGAYTMGLAVLIVNNKTTATMRIPWWSYANWKIVLESENGQRISIPLHNDWRVDHPSPDGYIVPLTLEPGGKAAFIVGADNCGPFEVRFGRCPWPPAIMRVEYRDKGNVIRSNPLLIRWCPETPEMPRDGPLN